MQFEIASYLYTIIFKVYKNIVKLTLQVLTCSRLHGSMYNDCERDWPYSIFA